mgnify:CR=1 FL=1
MSEENISDADTVSDADAERVGSAKNAGDLMVDRIAAQQDTIEELRASLHRWQQVGVTLWPVVQHWPLAGASAEHVAALVELAGLLGINDSVIRADVEDGRTSAAVDHLIELFQHNPAVIRKVGTKNAAALADFMRALAIENLS